VAWFLDLYYLKYLGSITIVVPQYSFVSLHISPQPVFLKLTQHSIGLLMCGMIINIPEPGETSVFTVFFRIYFIFFTIYSLELQ